ncbi:MAG: transposase [Solirubrobacteraceae bacterium]
MSTFPSARRLASWAGRCAGNDRCAGRGRPGRPRKGSKWLGIVLGEPAVAAISRNYFPPAATSNAPSNLSSQGSKPSDATSPPTSRSVNAGARPIRE